MCATFGMPSHWVDFSIFFSWHTNHLCSRIRFSQLQTLDWIVFRNVRYRTESNLSTFFRIHFNSPIYLKKEKKNSALHSIYDCCFSRFSFAWWTTMFRICNGKREMISIIQCVNYVEKATSLARRFALFSIKSFNKNMYRSTTNYSIDETTK